MSDDWTLLSLVSSSGFGASNSSLPCSSVNIFDFRKGVASKCLVPCASHRQSNWIVLCQVVWQRLGPNQTDRQKRSFGKSQILKLEHVE